MSNEHDTSLRESLDRLKQLRDEIRLKIHLAGMEAKDEWRAMEAELDELERRAARGLAGVPAALNDAIRRLEPIAEGLGNVGI